MLDDVLRATSGPIRNKYLYTLAVAHRARKLIQDAAFSKQPLKENPIIMALKDFREGRIRVEVLDEEIKRALEGHSEEVLP
ncbi:MAG: hypothetical protein GDYSWBUE_000617 [Candidatus Fervidibacterota bacterium]